VPVVAAAPAEPEPPRKRGAVLPPLLGLLAVLAGWQVLCSTGLLSARTVPAPAEVAAALSRLAASGEIGTALATSLGRGAVGFAVAVAIGTPLGLLLAAVRPLRAALGPWVTGLQVLPSVAWVPLAVLWFGLTDATVYVVVLASAVPALVNGVLAGVDQVPPLFHRVGAALGARGPALVRHVVLPAALPGYVAGLRQGWAFSWRALMSAEIIAVGGELGFGLGTMLQEGRERADVAAVAATVLLVLAVGIAVELLVLGPLERSVLRRRGLEGTR
jgi:NitT/TauT family transport system permease protein